MSKALQRGTAMLAVLMASVVFVTTATIAGFPLLI